MKVAYLCTLLCCRRKGKSSAAVHSSNLVVLESAGGEVGDDGELEMGNKSSGGLTPADGKKQSGGLLPWACAVHLAHILQLPGHTCSLPHVK